MIRSRSITFFSALAALPLAALALAACGGGSNTTTAGPTTASGRPATIGVASEDIGKILVDSQGRTLYLFEKDSGTTSTCTGECAKDWPPLRAKGMPTEGSGAKPSLVGTSMRPDGEPQVTYNGHPLYRFEGDKKPGDANGEGLTAFGGAWFPLTPAGAEVSVQASPSKGYGY